MRNECIDRDYPCGAGEVLDPSQVQPNQDIIISRVGRDYDGPERDNLPNSYGVEVAAETVPEGRGY